jgi:hypothetical protein
VSLARLRPLFMPGSFPYRRFSEVRIAAVQHPWASLTETGCLERYYLAFPDFLIIPIGDAMPHGGSWPIGPGQWALRGNFPCSECSELHRRFIAACFDEEAAACRASGAGGESRNEGKGGHAGDLHA